ncbi:CHAT domain-containing protein [Desulfovibrio inopinatus]|uniref:CHAT domain-containing protein n=1 Tax=Desulfovibrio inopinatus TaxID=102109 RepID=UPI00040F51B1|nr:CHAT domain-containing protein [Desulfovibrio inopinatus]
MPIELRIREQNLSTLVGNEVYGSRDIDDKAVHDLNDFASRYDGIVERRPKQAKADLLTLGCELYAWIAANAPGLSRALDECSPALLEIICTSRKPNATEAAILDAPWELLADEDGFFAYDLTRRFTPVRRIQEAKKPPTLDTFRLGVVFMAASPRNEILLDYEAEEAAILQAVGETHIDLVVEETGELNELAHTLAGLDPMTVLHVSCHGTNKPTPCLALENETGDCVLTTASDLVMKLPTAAGRTPRFLFVSACKTSLPGHMETGPAQSLAAAMARSGLPAVLGWNGSVGDQSATLFAKELYASLADRQPLEDAVCHARFRLLENTELQYNDWHMARLWLGAQGGGPLIGGTTERSLVPATHGHKEFLGKKADIPVASHEMFVGRRRELKEGLRVLAGNECAGLLLMGMGRLGKSSLAARLATRRPDMALAVVYGKFNGAIAILDALAEALQGNADAQDIISSSRAELIRHPESLERVLQRLVCEKQAPCRQQTPVLLVIDDLEQILRPPTDHTSPYHVHESYAPILHALVKTFDPRQTKSRLLFTSRYAFRLDGMEHRLHTIQLAAFKEEEQHKLLLRQRQVADGTKRTDTAREPLVQRALKVSQGNPGLQDMIVGKFALQTDVPEERVEQVLNEMEAYLQGGNLPTEETTRAFLENLALDTLLDLAGDAGRDLLRAVNCVELPIPESIVQRLADTMGGNITHLRGLGLLEPSEDLVQPTHTALAVNALAAARLKQVTETEAQAIIPLILEPLYTAWGGDYHRKKASLTDIELFRLALVVEHGRIAATCGEYAVEALVSHIGNGDAATMGKVALKLCTQQNISPPPKLLIYTARACFAAGKPEEAKAILLTLEAQLERMKKNGEAVEDLTRLSLFLDLGRIFQRQGALEEAKTQFQHMKEHAVATELEREQAIAAGEIADILRTLGQLDEALEIRLTEELPVYDKLGDVRSLAVTQGQIADILQARGQLDEALEIRQELQLPVYEKLGDVRSLALTQGKIADILFARGQLDQALEIRMEQELPVYMKLDDKNSIASTLWDIAQIEMTHGKMEDAAPKIAEAYALFSAMGRLEGIAVIGQFFGQLLIVSGHHDEGLDVLQRSVDGFRQLSREADAQEVESNMKQAREYITTHPKEN